MSILYYSRLLLVAAFSIGTMSFLSASVTVAAIFSDHAVLQKSDNVPVWGKAAPNENVTVSLDKATATATAGADGKWKARLNLHDEGAGPYELTIKGASDQISIKDVVIGEVWLCSGQSNMYFHLYESADAQIEVARSTNPLLREFTVTDGPVPVPADEVHGQWVLCDPKTAGGFTAVGYYFGKRLQQELKVPVGLINSSRGGTPVEAWTSADALSTDPTLKAGMEKAQSDYVAYTDGMTKYQAWLAKYQRQDHPLPVSVDEYVSPDAATTDWKPLNLNLPDSFTAAGLPEDGAIWIRRKLTISADYLKAHNWPVYLGDFKDPVTVYVDGKKVGQGMESAEGKPQTVPITSLHVGECTLAIRIYCATGNPDKIEFKTPDSNLRMDWGWSGKVEFTLPPLDGQAKADLPVLAPTPKRNMPHWIADYLFNGMIYPLIPYTLAGVIWYQGEGNASAAKQYQTGFPLMIKDWRQHWGNCNFPFYFCQLAGLKAISKTPGDCQWAELREAQSMTLSLPNTGQAVLIDIGEAGTVHPRDKLDVGNRLALIALAKTYGKPVVFSGPMYDTMAIEGDKIRVKFKYTDGGLEARPLPATYTPLSVNPQVTLPLVRNSPNSQIEGFMICGDDHKWHWADAKIDGTDVVVSSADVPKPIAVRYGWADNPFGNLYNCDLPACPFRTDNFPGISNDHY